MEAKNADLAALRINRSPEPTAGPSPRRARRWLAIGLPAATVVVAAALVLAGGALPAREGGHRGRGGGGRRRAGGAREYRHPRALRRHGPDQERRRGGGGGAARRERVFQERRRDGGRPALASGRGRRGGIEPRGRQPRPAVRDRAGRVSRRALPGRRGQDRADGGPRQRDGAGEGWRPLLRRAGAGV